MLLAFQDRSSWRSSPLFRKRLVAQKFSQLFLAYSKSSPASIPSVHPESNETRKQKK
jgi:hypothetical protein